MVAISNGCSSRTIEILLRHGADPNLGISIGLTPLIQAAHIKHGKQILTLLIQHGAEINKRGMGGLTALHQGCLSARAFSVEQGVEILLEAGADPNQQDDDGRTALYAASLDPTFRVLLLLMKARANPFLLPSGTTLGESIAMYSSYRIHHSLLTQYPKYYRILESHRLCRDLENLLFQYMCGSCGLWCGG